MDKNNFTVWKTINLGTGLKTPRDFRRALHQGNFKLGSWVDNSIGKNQIIVASSEEEIELVNLSVVDLGFKNGATYRDICQRAKELGLDLCPNEVGPQLRLQYKDQLKNQSLRIAMEPIRQPGGKRQIFKVEHDGNGTWLHFCYGDPGRFWRPDHRFVFCLRK